MLNSSSVPDLLPSHPHHVPLVFLEDHLHPYSSATLRGICRYVYIFYYLFVLGVYYDNSNNNDSINYENINDNISYCRFIN